MQTHFRNVAEEEQYLDMLEYIHEAGVVKEDRTGTGTLSLFGQTMRFNLKDNALPLLTTKQHFHRTFTHENLWFISGDTDVGYLKSKGISIWDSWVMPGTERYRDATVKELEKLLENTVKLEVPVNARSVRIVTELTDEFVHVPTGGLVYRLVKDEASEVVDVEVYVHQPEGVQYTEQELLRLAVNRDPLDEDAIERIVHRLASDMQQPFAAFQLEVLSAAGATAHEREPANPDGAPVLLEVHQPDPSKRASLVVWFHQAVWASCVRDSYGETRATAMDYLAALSGYKTQKLAGGSIGKGAYGAMWRDIEDTRIIPLRTKERPVEDLEDEVRDMLNIQPHMALSFQQCYDPTDKPFTVKGEVTVSRSNAFVKVFQFSGGPANQDPCADPQQLYATQIKALAAQLRIRLEDTELFDAQDYTSKGFDVKGRLRDGSVVVSRRIDQLQNAINLLRENPDSRRIIVHAFDNRHADMVPLPPCHSLFQFWTRKLTLHERVVWIKQNDPDLYEDWIGHDLSNVAWGDRDEYAHEWLTRYGAPERGLSCLLYQR